MRQNVSECGKNLSVHQLPGCSEFTPASGGPQKGGKMTGMDILEFRDIDGPDPYNYYGITNIFKKLYVSIWNIWLLEFEKVS